MKYIIWKITYFCKKSLFNNLNLGNTKISSEIYKNKMVRLMVKFLDNKKEHSYFNYLLNKKKIVS